MFTAFILSLILTMGKVCLLYPLSSKFLNYKRLETFWSIQAVSKTRRSVCESHFKIIFSQEICLFADVPGELIFSNDQPHDLPGPGGGLVPCYSGSFTSSVVPCLQSCHPNWLTSARFSLSLPGNQLNLRVGDRGKSGVWSRPSTPGPLSPNTSHSEAGSSLSFRKSSRMHFNLWRALNCLKPAVYNYKRQPPNSSVMNRFVEANAWNQKYFVEQMFPTQQFLKLNQSWTKSLLNIKSLNQYANQSVQWKYTFSATVITC